MSTTRLRTERQARGLSQAQLSQITGIGAPNLSRLEHGRMSAYPGWAHKIAAALAWHGDPAVLFEPVDDSPAAGRLKDGTAEGLQTGTFSAPDSPDSDGVC